MSVSPHRAWVFRPRHIFVSAAILFSGACHRAPSPAPEPRVVEPSGQPPQLTEDGRVIRFAGVDIIPTDRSGFRIRIHSAMVGDGEPLYVIDGVRMMIPPNRGIDWFRPEDISELKVLKLPYELAEYGPTGVNGVIVITTKQALRQRKRR